MFLSVANLVFYPYHDIGNAESNHLLYQEINGLGIHDSICFCQPPVPRLSVSRKGIFLSAKRRRLRDAMDRLCIFTFMVIAFFLQKELCIGLFVLGFAHLFLQMLEDDEEDRHHKEQGQCTYRHTTYNTCTE